MEDCGTALGQSLQATPDESLTSRVIQVLSPVWVTGMRLLKQGGGGTKMKLLLFRKGDSLDLSRGLHYLASFSLSQQEHKEAFLAHGPFPQELQAHS